MTKGFNNKTGIDLLNNKEKDINELIKILQKHYLNMVGWSKKDIDDRIYDEINMLREITFVKKFKNNYEVRNKSILDVGCGLGGYVVQLGLEGAKAVGMEPSEGYSTVAKKRIKKYNLQEKCRCVVSSGEIIPLKDNSFDYIICFSVLEHVSDPYSVIDEMVRVVKPGGIIFIQTENYFSFWDAHYRILWFPLMPKKLAKIYLKIRGKDTYVFENYITYVTFFSLKKYINKMNNIEDLSLEFIKDRIRNPENIKSSFSKFLVNVVKVFKLDGLLARFVFGIIYLKNMIKPSVNFKLKKLDNKNK